MRPRGKAKCSKIGKQGSNIHILKTIEETGKELILDLLPVSSLTRIDLSAPMCTSDLGPIVGKQWVYALMQPSKLWTTLDQTEGKL